MQKLQIQILNCLKDELMQCKQTKGAERWKEGRLCPLRTTLGTRGEHSDSIHSELFRYMQFLPIGFSHSNELNPKNPNAQL